MTSRVGRWTGKEGEGGLERHVQEAKKKEKEKT
jgi:hypothetical protein